MLSLNQLGIMQALSHGMSASEIAEQTNVSPKSISRHIGAIVAKVPCTAFHSQTWTAITRWYIYHVELESISDQGTIKNLATKTIDFEN